MTKLQILHRFPTLRECGVAAERFDGFVRTELDMHGLDVVLLTFVLAGEGRHVIDGRDYPITGLSFAITSIDEYHGLITDRAGLDVVNVYLTPDAIRARSLPPPLDRAMAALFPSTGRRREHLPQVALDDEDEVRALLFLLERETNEGAIGVGHVLHSILGALLVACCRSLMKRGFLPERPPQNRTHIAVDEVRSYLEQHYTERVTLDQLAAVAHLERTYLSRAFKDRTGVTITDFTCDLRVQYAASMLRSGDSSVTDVAQASGFNDITHFGRSFRRRTGLSPRDYRAVVLNAGSRHRALAPK